MVRIVARRLAIFIVLSLLALGAATSRAQIDPGAPPEILWTLPISAMPYTAACDDTGNLFVGGVDVARGWHDGSALLKFSPNGHQAWSIPLPSGTFVRSVRIDPAGQVVVLGQVFTNRYRFGATRVSTGARSGFYIARFTGDGRLLSVRAAGGPHRKQSTITRESRDVKARPRTCTHTRRTKPIAIGEYLPEDDNLARRIDADAAHKGAGRKRNRPGLMTVWAELEQSASVVPTTCDINTTHEEVSRIIARRSVGHR